MQCFKVIIIFFILVCSSQSIASNMVNSVLDQPMKAFHHTLPTHTPGQYIEYNQRLLTLRQYNDQGLDKEFSVELSGHSDHNSNFKAYLDSTANAIWVTDSFRGSEPNSYYFTIEKYVFNEDGFTGEQQSITLPAGFIDEIHGFNNNNIYAVIESDSNASVIFAEIDLSNELLPRKRSLSLETRFNSRISPNGKFFITNTGVISLVGPEMTYTEVDFVVDIHQAPFFIDDNTIMYRHWTGFYIGSIDDNLISSSLLLANDSPELQFEYNAQYLNASSRTINFFSRNDELLKSFSIDKRNNSWQLNNIELSTYKRTSGDYYRRTLNGGLISKNFNLTYLDGQWLLHEKLVKGFELDKGAVFVSNLNDVQSNELYAIFTGDVNRLKKLALIADGSYQWHDILELPEQLGDITFATQYQGKIYIFSNHWDGMPDTLDTTPTKVTTLNINDNQTTTTEIPFLLFAGFEVNIYHGHLYLTSFHTALKCTIEMFECENITPSMHISGAPQYFNNFLYFYAYDENKLVFYDTKSGGDWQTSSVELPIRNNSSGALEIFGDQLRFEHSLLAFKQNGEIDSLTDIVSVNSDYLGLYAENNFYNSKVTCDERLLKCAYFEENYSLAFTAINDGESLHDYKRVKGTSFFYDRYDQTHSLEIFKEKDNLIFPEFKAVLPAEKEVWQNETLKISLNDYFKNIDYYEHSTEYGGAIYGFDHYDEFIADSNGDLEVTLTNDHTWQEYMIPFSTYTGYNDNFILPVPLVSLIVRDVNEVPVVREGASLTLTVNAKDYIDIILDEIFYDLERKKINFTVNTQPLPKGVLFQLDRYIRGAISKAGTYNINVTVTDTSPEQLSADYTLIINVKNSKGDIPSATDKASSSGGTFGWGLLILVTLFFMPRRRLK